MRDETPPPEPDIAVMTEAMAAGDEEAFATFFTLYFSRLHRYLLVVTRGDHDLAQETLQATFLRVAKHIKRIETEAELWRWLTVLGRSAVWDLLRKRKSEAQKVVAMPSALAESEVIPDASNEEIEAFIGALDEALAELEPSERWLIEAIYFENKSHKTVADAAEISAKAIESRLARIRQKLSRAVRKKLNL